MKIDINYSEEKESHVGLYENILSGEIFFFSDFDSDCVAMLVKSNHGNSKIGSYFKNFISCTNCNVWKKINLDSVTFNLKD